MIRRCGLVTSLLGGLVLTLGACEPPDPSEGEGETEGSEEGDTDGLPPIDPRICEEMEFDNAVDEAACDEIWGRGIEPAYADDVEMCRRLYVDLTGSLPTRQEYKDDCEDRSVEDIVDDLMGREAYVLLGQREWADRLQMTSGLTLFSYLVELDELTGDLYRGDMRLPRYAELVTTHPGFTGRFDGQDQVGYSFLAFLGRDAAPHERIALEPLWHMWQGRFEEMHPDYYFGYTRQVVNTIMCMGNNEGACHSDLWGHHSVVIPVVEEDNYDYDGVNVFAVEDLDSDEWDTLRLPGRLIAAQATFYEAAADRSLNRYLGYEAGHEIPLVRQRLVDMFHDNEGAVREVEREILTSVLYTMAADYSEAEGATSENADPEYWHGPLKQLDAEGWLDSAEKFTGVEIGSCDHRFTDVQGGRPTDDSPYEDTVWHPNTFPIDPDWPPDANKPLYGYRDIARALGGCPDQQGQLRFTGTGVMISIGYSAAATAVCEIAEPGSPLRPNAVDDASKSEEDLTDIAASMFRQATTRSPDDDVDALIAGAVSGCRDDVDCEPATFANQICISLLESAPVVFY